MDEVGIPSEIFLDAMGLSCGTLLGISLYAIRQTNLKGSFNLYDGHEALSEQSVTLFCRLPLDMESHRDSKDIT